MKIQLTPEDEKLIEARLRSGAFGNPAEVIHDALAAQDFEARWLARNKQPLNDKIARGIDQLDRGGLATPEKARARPNERKSRWTGEIPST